MEFLKCTVLYGLRGLDYFEMHICGLIDKAYLSVMCCSELCNSTQELELVNSSESI